MSQQIRGKLWKKIGRNNSNQFSSQSSSIELAPNKENNQKIKQEDNLKIKNKMQQLSDKQQSEIEEVSQIKTQNSMDFINKMKSLGVQIKEVEPVAEVSPVFEKNILQSNSIFSKMANQFQANFLGKSLQDINNSLEQNYSPMLALGSPFISSHSNRYSIFKSSLASNKFECLQKLLLQINSQRELIKQEVYNTMTFFQNMKKIYEEYSIRLMKKHLLNHSIIDQNSLQDNSEYQPKQIDNNFQENSEKLIGELKKQLQSKINLIQQLQDLVQTNKNQYLTFKQMYQKTNQELNQELDQMEKKLAQTKSKCQEYEKNKLTIEIQLQNLRQANQNIQKKQSQSERKQLQMSASFKLIEEQQTKTVGRLFTFGQNQSNKKNVQESPQSVKRQENKGKHQQKQQKKQCTNLQSNNMYKLLQLKQKKLKQYQKTIQQISEQINLLSIKSNTLQKQLIKKNNQYQNFKMQNQKTTSLLFDTNQKIKHLIQQKNKYQQYTQSLEQNVFDFQQKAEQVQQQCECKILFLKQQVQQQQSKFKILEQNYKNIVQKLAQHSISKTQQNLSNLSIDSPIKQSKLGQNLNIKSKSQIKIISQLQHELQTYKNMYQQKEKQVKKLQNKLSKLEEHNINLIQDQMQRETDKFRLQSFRQESKLKENILQSYKSQKEELLNLLNNQREELVQKSIKIDQLQLKINKMSTQLKQSNQNKSNPIDSILDNLKLKKQKQGLICDCAKKEKILFQQKEKLHHLQMHLQSQKRMLEVTKKQIQAQYQALLIKFNQLQSNQLENINYKSFLHLSSPIKNVLVNDRTNQYYPNNTNFRNSLAALPRTFDNQQQNISYQASRIIQRLKSQGSLRKSSLERSQSKNKIFNQSFTDRQKFYHSNLFNPNIKLKKHFINGIPIQKREDTQISPLKQKIKQRGQSRKLKMKLIEQKMKKLKDQVKNSLS